MISGTPSVAGKANHTFKVTDSSTPTKNSTSKILTLDILKGTQAITFTSGAPSSPPIGSTYTVTATATSGLKVVFSIDATSTKGTCPYVSPKVTFKAAGTCKIDAKQAGNTSWSAAPEAQQTISVP